MYHARVGIFVKVLVALLIVVAVATILVTPNPKDDVVGVLHRFHAVMAQVAFLGLSHILPLLITSSLLKDTPAEVIPCLNVLDLVCVRLC